jgi:hypothetical protein
VLELAGGITGLDAQELRAVLLVDAADGAVLADDAVVAPDDDRPAPGERLKVRLDVADAADSGKLEAGVLGVDEVGGPGAGRPGELEDVRRRSERRRCREAPRPWPSAPPRPPGHPGR